MRNLVANFVIALTIVPLTVSAQEVEVEASKDNTLYESSTGALSNGAGIHLFAGTTNLGAIRRGLLMFDVAAAVPNGSTVESARLELNMTRTVSASVQVNLHKVLGDWGEAGSDAEGNEGGGAPALNDDATWIHRFRDTETWQTPGGDFVAAPSASADVSGLGGYAWESTPALVADVQSWIDTPEENFGWILIGDEDNDRTAKRFDSRENATAANRPRLILTLATNTASDSDELPAASNLEEAYPNPFSGSTEIGFQLGHDSDVTLEVFDVTGRRVAELVDGFLPAGRHSVSFEANDLPAGLYVSRLTSTGSNGEHGVATRTLVLAR